MDLIKYIIFASLSLTRWMKSFGIWGCQERKMVFNTITIVLCMHSHIAFGWEILIVVKISLNPNTQRRWVKAYPVNWPPYCHGQNVPVLGNMQMRFVHIYFCSDITYLVSIHNSPIHAWNSLLKCHALVVDGPQLHTTAYWWGLILVRVPGHCEGSS